MEDLLKITIGECECTSNFMVKFVYYVILTIGATVIFFAITNNITQAYVFSRISSPGIKILTECLVFFAIILLYDLLIQYWRETICFVE